MFYSSILHTPHGYLGKGTYLYLLAPYDHIQTLILHSVRKTLYPLLWPSLSSILLLVTPSTFVGPQSNSLPQVLPRLQVTFTSSLFTSHSCGFTLNVTITQSYFNSANLKSNIPPKPITSPFSSSLF